MTEGTQAFASVRVSGRLIGAYRVLMIGRRGPSETLHGRTLCYLTNDTHISRIRILVSRLRLAFLMQSFSRDHVGRWLDVGLVTRSGKRTRLRSGLDSEGLKLKGGTVPTRTTIRDMLIDISRFCYRRHMSAQ